METLTLKIKNKRKIHQFLKFIKDLDYVEVLKSSPTINLKSGAEEDFFSITGMWENREISTESLRKKAWPQRS